MICLADGDICHRLSPVDLCTVRKMMDKLVLLALCALLLVHHHGEVAAVDVIAMLVAACCAALSEWLLTARSVCSWLPVAAVSAAALFVPTLAFVIPVITYDAARLNITDTPSHMFRPAPVMPRFAFLCNARHDKHVMHNVHAGFAAVTQYVWILPLAIALLQCSNERMTLAIITLLAYASFIWGAQTRNVMSLFARLRDEQDRNRANIRDLRSRVTDLQEDQAQATRMATLNERTRIARDIHDNVGHVLTRAIMQAEADRVVAEARNDAVAAKQFAEVGDSIKEAMTMVRQSVHDLDDAGVDFATWIADAARAAGKLHVELRNTVTTAVPAPVARCLAAVIRESLANTARHGEADSVTVTVQAFPAFWQLAVQDNGKQSASASSPNSSEGAVAGYRATDKRGMGLADIEARVQALDGTCTWGPNSTGWRVFVSIPKADRQGGQI